MSDLLSKDKDKHFKHRQSNLIAKHLKDERDGLYRLKIIPPKKEYHRKKLRVQDIEKELYDETESTREG